LYKGFKENNFMKNSWLKYFVIGTELASAILGGMFLGSMLDSKFKTESLFSIIGIILGTIGGFYLMIKIINNFDKKKK
jgi:F0F1-type ATP synthase assembly protein I